MRALSGAAREDEPAASEHTVAEDVGRADVYLTDEVFLYRVVQANGNGEDAMVEIEDCYGLDVVRVPASELQRRQLRVVRAAPR